MKYVLLKQYIPGHTFDMFRSNGYDILQMVDVETPIDVPKDALERILTENIKHKAVEHVLEKKRK